MNFLNKDQQLRILELLEEIVKFIEEQREEKTKPSLPLKKPSRKKDYK